MSSQSPEPELKLFDFTDRALRVEALRTATKLDLKDKMQTKVAAEEFYRWLRADA